MAMSPLSPSPYPSPGLLDTTSSQSTSPSYNPSSLWTGPSTLLTIRTSKNNPFSSLLKSTFKEPTGINKQHHSGRVHLGPLGFDGDEHYYKVHGGPEKAVLQYNPDHYVEWKKILKDVPARDEKRRDELLNLGGFGENMAVRDGDEVPMDERTMCIGDLVAFRTFDENGMVKEHGRMRVTGPRNPCFKLNHRFGIADMSQRTQDRSWTGWLYSVEKEGDVEVGQEVALLERPFPDWPVARIQHYLFKEPKNIDMLREALSTLGEYLVYDVRETFTNRLTKGVEDMSKRLQGDKEEVFVEYKLRDRIRETDRVSQFTFERVQKIAKESPEYTIAESGSHVRLRFKLKDPATGTKSGLAMIRPYSVISGNSNTFTLGIAIADNSRGGSTYLHKQLQIGDVLEVSEKFANTFALQPNKETDEHIFLAGGIGITAFLDHIKYCLDTQQRFHLHYMIRNESDHAFKALLEEMMADADGESGTSNSASDSEDRSGQSSSSSRGKKQRISVYVSADKTRCNTKSVLAKVAKHSKTHIYVCGSEKLSDAIRREAECLKIPQSRLHFEQFSLDTSGDPFTVEFARQPGKKVEVSENQTLLDALRDAGLNIASSCEAGNCATCTVKVKCGRILHKGTGLPDDEKAGNDGKEEGDMLSCVSRGVGTICLDL